MLLLSATLVFDLSTGRTSDRAVSLSGGRTFIADFVVSSLNYDNPQGLATADIDITARRPSVGKSLFNHGWVSATPLGPRVPCGQVGQGEETDRSNRVADIVRISCPGVALAIARRGYAPYPFDQFVLEIDPRICITESASDCSYDEINVSVRRIQVTMGGHSVIVRDIEKDSAAPLQFLLERSFFLRGSAVLLAAVAIIFIYALARIEQTGDLFKGALGYFGGLWATRALLVSPEVKQFPTLVDYAVVVLYMVLFAILLWRYEPPERKSDETYYRQVGDSD